MKFYWILLLFTTFGCGNTVEKSTDVIGEELPDVATPNPEIINTIPKDALTGNFSVDGIPFYSYVKEINSKTETTIIAFEENKYSPIIIPESIGAQLEILKLENFDQDLLLVNAKLKDTNFNEYYLYSLKGNTWKPIMNRFDIHKSNMNDTLVPIRINPDKENELIRYYSVFDIDRTSEKKYKWQLLEESIAIEK